MPVFVGHLRTEARDISLQDRFKQAERFYAQFFMPPWTLEELNEKVMALHQVQRR